MFTTNSGGRDDDGFSRHLQYAPNFSWVQNVLTGVFVCLWRDFALILWGAFILLFLQSPFTKSSYSFICGLIQVVWPEKTADESYIRNTTFFNRTFQVLINRLSDVDLVVYLWIKNERLLNPFVFVLILISSQ